MSANERALWTVGVDVGSSAIKVVVMRDEDGGGPKLCAQVTERLRRRDAMAVVDGALAQALLQANLASSDVDYVATTGEGEKVECRTGHFYGMTTHARGGLWLDPQVRAVVDIGALHARAVLMDERAKVLGHRMTSQCASGSGQFLENICRYLGVTIDEIGPLSQQADNPEVCSSICAVLAETDVINMVSRGISIPNILKGIHQSMAGRYLRLLTSAGARGPVLVTGGLSRDEGLLAALREAVAEQKVPIEIRTHADAVLAGAIGAALWGAFRHRKLQLKGVSLGGAR
ncbi:MAG TPA: benzoyl-CoA reductase subunit D [Planctomycetota bacterium]|nr:benzoyl-CoA reductase subunit D [Planctomycetota bacterium]